MNRLDGKVLGAAMGVFLALGYVVCILFDLIFHETMYRAWVAMLPGFHWLSLGSFLLGLVDVVVYGVFFGLVFAPLYNFFLTKVWHYAP